MQKNFPKFYKRRKLTLIVVAVFGLLSGVPFAVFGLSDSLKNIAIITFALVLLFILLYETWIKRIEK